MSRSSKAFPLISSWGQWASSRATGLNCTDCHLDESGAIGRSMQTTTPKQMACRMMVMVNTINQTNFGGRQVVTCFTCHQGGVTSQCHVEHRSALQQPAALRAGRSDWTGTRTASADQLFEKYSDGDSVASSVSTCPRELHCERDAIWVRRCRQESLEMYAQAPAKRTLISHTPSGDFAWVFDGQSGWVAAPLTDRPLPVMPVTGQDLEGLAAEVQVLFPAGLKQALTNWRVGIPPRLAIARCTSFRQPHATAASSRSASIRRPHCSRAL